MDISSGNTKEEQEQHDAEAAGYKDLKNEELNLKPKPAKINIKMEPDSSPEMHDNIEFLDLQIKHEEVDISDMEFDIESDTEPFDSTSKEPPLDNIKPDHDGENAPSEESSCHVAEFLKKKKVAKRVNGMDKAAAKLAATVTPSGSLHRHVTVLPDGNKTFQCAICDSKFNKKYSMRSHLLQHFPRERVECKICKKSFADENNKAEHMVRHGAKEHKCGVCKKEFYYSKYLRRHVMVYHEGIKNFQCALCDRKFSSKDSLKYHISTHFPGNKVECNICKKKLPSFYLARHMVTHGTETHKCTICAKEFHNVFNLRLHMIAHHDAEKYQCSLCDKKFTVKRSLKNHMMSVHMGSNKFQCEVCKKFFTLKKYKDRHMLTHGVRKHKCSVCDLKFHDYSNMLQHTRVVHGVQQFQCGLCDKKFSWKSSLKVHIISSHSDRHKFQCEVCKKQFAYEKYKKKHMIIHAAKQHKCSLCDKEFYRIAGMRKHIQIVHKGVKKFQCPQCSMKFYDNYSLKMHLKSHVPKPNNKVKCEVCKKLFAARGLSKHMRMHRPK